MNASDLASSTAQGRTDIHEVGLGAEPGGVGFWWAVLFNATGTFGSVLGSAHAAARVRLTCVCRESRSSCAANGTYGIWGSASCLLPLAAGIPTFPLLWRNLAAPGHYSPALSFSLVLGGRWVSSSTGCALCLAQGAAPTGLACADLCQAHQCVPVGMSAGCPVPAGPVPALSCLSSCKREHVASVSALLFSCMGAGVKPWLWRHRCFAQKRGFLASFELH